MSNNIKNSYIKYEIEEIFNDWYEIEGVRKIKELSRQLQTFFNYKTEVIRYRFQTKLNPLEKTSDTKFFIQKQKMESLSYEFIKLLKEFNVSDQPIEEGIRSLFFNNEKIHINKLSYINEKLSVLLHYFSEENIHNHLRFFKFITVLAQKICLVKKCLMPQFSEFYEELEINYNNLEEELEFLLEEVINMTTKKPDKQLKEKLTS